MERVKEKKESQAFRQMLKERELNEVSGLFLRAKGLGLGWANTKKIKNQDQINIVNEIMKGEGVAGRQNRASYGVGGGKERVGQHDPLQRLEIKTSMINVLDRKIGVGAFGEVHRAKYKGSEVAVKQLTVVDEHSMKEFRHEVLLLSQMRHPNIIFMLGAVWR